MRKLFLFLIIALFINSCAGSPKIPETTLVDEARDEETATPVEVAEQPMLETSELAALPVEEEEINEIAEAVIDEAETVELAEETTPVPVTDELEIAEHTLVELSEPVTVPEVLTELISDVVPEVIQKGMPEIIAEGTRPPIIEATPPSETVPLLETIPLPEMIPSTVAVPPPVDPAPEPAPVQIAQIPPPVEEEKPPVVPAPPLYEIPVPLPALSGQFEERELLPGNFSRIVQAVTGQLIEIPFNGNGWLYLGEAESRRGIAYESRRVDPEGQSFIFRADAAGIYALKFYRQDFVRNFILNDQVQVIISEAIGGVASNRNRVIAEPRWPSQAEEAQALRSNSRPASPDGLTRPPSVDSGALARETSTPSVTPVQQATTPAQPVTTVQATPQQSTQPERTSSIPTSSPSEGLTAIQPPALVVEAVTPSVPSAPPPLAADAYLKQAKDEFDAAHVAQAISLLDQYSVHYPPESTMSDELYWLYGQFYEASSPSRNILLSLDYYRRLINEYPQSSRCNDARRRISYLERYFINNR